MTVDTTPRVIICGAGPVGLFVALKLSRANVPCLVLEKVRSLACHIEMVVNLRLGAGYFEDSEGVWV